MPQAPNKSPPRQLAVAGAVAIIKQSAQQRRNKSTRSEQQEEIALERRQHQLFLKHQAEERRLLNQAQQAQAELAAPSTAPGSGSTLPDQASYCGSEVDHKGAEMKIRDGRDLAVGARLLPLPDMPPLRLDKRRASTHPAKDAGSTHSHASATTFAHSLDGSADE